MKKVLFLLTIILLCQPVFGQYFHAARTGVHLTLPGAGWGLDFDAKDFLVEDTKAAPDRTSVSCRAGGNDIIMLCYFEYAPVEGNAVACRDYYMEKSKEAPMTVSGLRSYEMGKVAVFEYLVTAYQGNPANQMNIHAYLARNGYCAEVHLSRSNYTTESYEDLVEILNEVRASNEVEPDLLLQLDFATTYYKDGNYDSAIVEYEKLIAREDELKKYNLFFWYIAIDNLAMSYGLNGDPDRAIEICKRGLKQDKKYPMFYYTIACAYAEKNDGKRALENLKKAFKYKDNMLPGEVLPDPFEDESFQELLKDNDFYKGVEELVF
ncbi:MAG: hypothetical protein R3F48_01705 [Candidatus Zixiibacteriota bacterium]